jgi:hypothetical protein
LARRGQLAWLVSRVSWPSRPVTGKAVASQIGCQAGWLVSGHGRTLPHAADGA